MNVSRVIDLSASSSTSRTTPSVPHAVCAACGHPESQHSSGGMCAGAPPDGSECYCVLFPPLPEVWQHHAGVGCVECPVCAFTFAADHQDQQGGYSCPVCAEAEHLDLLEQQDAAIEVMTHYLDDLLDRARALRVSEYPRHEAGAFVMYTKTRLEELVRRLSLNQQIAERRADPDFQARLARSLAENEDILARLADKPFGWPMNPKGTR